MAALLAEKLGIDNKVVVRGAPACLPACLPRRVLVRVCARLLCVRPNFMCAGAAGQVCKGSPPVPLVSLEHIGAEEEARGSPLPFLAVRPPSRPPSSPCPPLYRKSRGALEGQLWVWTAVGATCP